MVKRNTGGGDKPYKTDYSFADRYIDERRIPVYVPIRVKFPYIEDRRAANVDYKNQQDDPQLLRTYRGNIPGPGIDYNNLTVAKTPDFSDTQYQFISDAKNGSNIPEGYVATSSGIEPMTSTPFSVGDPTDNPLQVDEYFDNSAEEAEFIIAKYIRTENERGERYPYRVDNANNPGRFEWDTAGYESPTEPEVRFPSGARRKRTFKY